MAAVNQLCSRNLQCCTNSLKLCRGRCRSQPFATKERYGCGSAACRYTLARWEVPNSPKISVKPVHSAGSMWASTPTNLRGDCVGNFELHQISRERSKKTEAVFLGALRGLRGEIEIPPGSSSFCHSPQILFACSCTGKRITGHKKGPAAAGPLIVISQ